MGAEQLRLVQEELDLSDAEAERIWEETQASQEEEVSRSTHRHFASGLKVGEALWFV